MMSLLRPDTLKGCLDDIQLSRPWVLLLTASRGSVNMFWHSQGTNMRRHCGCQLGLMHLQV